MNGLQDPSQSTAKPGRPALRLVLALAAALLSSPCLAQEVVGDWHGSLGRGMTKLPVILHIRRLDGALAATLDSPVRDAIGVKAQSISQTGDHLAFGLPGSDAFDGVVSADGESIDGRWRQGQAEFPFQLTRGVGPAGSPRRTQTPAAPLPYRDEEVSYHNAAAAGVRLAGTLTLPEGKGPYPVVLLIAGSGSSTRDEDFSGHKPFMVLADALTRRGVAVLRVDKRGVGFSTGDAASATLDDYASDVKAGLAYLRTRSDIDARHIGLLGHSEGAIIAPLVAADDPNVAFVVMLAGLGVSFAEALPLQSARNALAAGMSKDWVDQRMVSDREIVAAVLAAPNEAEAFTAARALFAARTPNTPAATLDAQAKQISRPWARQTLPYDPAPALKRMKAPVLALNGSKDVQVPPDQSLPVIRDALAGNPDATVQEMPGLNHMFQNAITGGVSEYGVLKETISPAALTLISDWVVSRTGAPGQ